MGPVASPSGPARRLGRYRGVNVVGVHEDDVPTTEISGRAKADNSPTISSPTALPPDSRRQGQLYSSTQRRSPQNEVHRPPAGPRSVTPWPARPVTFLSVIYKILTRNPLYGKSASMAEKLPQVPDGSSACDAKGLYFSRLGVSPPHRVPQEIWYHLRMCVETEAGKEIGEALLMSSLL